MVLVPGHNCFAVSAPLPQGTLESEHEAVAMLALEQVSPFPIDQLATGYIAPEQGGGLVATAVYRRKLAAADTEAWKDAQAVLPDYATFLCGCRAAAATVVILETGASVTGLDFSEEGGVPRRIVSRAAGAAGEPDPAAAARDLVLSRLSAAGRTVHRYRLADVPAVQRGSRLRFNWEPVDGAPPVECEMPDRAVWAQDLRDSDESRARRKAAMLERWVVRSGLALVWILALLLVAECLLLLGGMWVGRREAALAGTAPAVQQIESDFEIAGRLDAYGAAKPRPLELLAYVNDLRPRSIYFTRTAFDSPGQMTIDAATANLADVNDYEAALRRAPGLALVQTRNTKAREGGATFQLILAFRPGFRPYPQAVTDGGSAAAPVGIPIAR